jgi:hypothetical protein
MRGQRSHLPERAAGGLAVDLHWDPNDPARAFRFDLVDRRSGERVVLFSGSRRQLSRRHTTPYEVKGRDARAPHLTLKEEYR